MAEEERARAAVRPMWSGTISFGLVSVPVDLLPAARSNRVPMRRLGPEGEPLRREYYCPLEERTVHPEHLMRGYELEKDRFVIVREDELEALQPAASRDIDLRRFVDASTIPPILFERPYFLVPASASNKAYRLLAAVMEKSGRAGVATFVMREKEYLAVILAENGVLRAQTLRFPDEVRTPEYIGLPERPKVRARDRRPMEAAVRALEADELDERLLRDEKRPRLLALVEEKERAGRDVVEVESGEAEAGSPAVINLMAALQASLAESPGGRRRDPGADAGPPIPDYEGLTAKELARKLPDLDPSELEVLLVYEQEHKDRKTVRQAIRRQLSEAA